MDKQKGARKIYRAWGKAWVSPEESGLRKSTWLGMSSPAPGSAVPPGALEAWALLVLLF